MSTVRHRDGTVDTLVVIPDVEYHAPSAAEPPRTIPFGVRAAILAAGDRLLIGDGARFRIDVYNLEGRLLRSVRKEHTRRPVREDDIEALRQRDLARARSPEQRRRIEERYRDLPHAGRMPAHGPEILLGSAGHLWVQEYPGPAEDPVRWSIFDPDGRFLGIIATPAPLRIHQVEEDAVIGVWTDALGVPSVRVYELVRGERGR